MVSENDSGLLFRTAGDITTDDLHYRVLLYGQSGAGKTWAAATAPDPVILLCEKNGLQSIRHSNPDAKVFTGPDPDRSMIMADVRAFIRAAMAKQLPGRTIVLDSLTEVQRLMMDELIAKKGKDGPPQMSKRDWGVLTEQVRRFMRTLRDLPYHVVCIGLADFELVESTGVRHVQPQMQGRSIKSEIPQWFNIVGYVFKRQVQADDGTETITHKIMLDGPARYIAKPCEPLGGILDPDLSDWFARLADNPSAGVDDASTTNETDNTKGDDDAPEEDVEF